MQARDTSQRARVLWWPPEFPGGPGWQGPSSHTGFFLEAGCWERRDLDLRLWVSEQSLRGWALMADSPPKPGASGPSMRGVWAVRQGPPCRRLTGVTLPGCRRGDRDSEMEPLTQSYSH